MRHWIVAAAAAAVLWPGVAGAEAPTAEQIANRVAQTLRDSGELKNYRVGVKYNEGTAWLAGSVTSDEQSAAAERLAAEVAGVDRVVNKLEVTPPAAEERGDVLQTLLQQEAAPQPLPPNPTAMPAPQRTASRGMPRPMQRIGAPHGQPSPIQQTPVQQAQYGAAYAGGAMPQGYSTAGARGVSYDGANMPGYAWPSYAAHPNYAAVTYPQQYSPAAWPYIGPFYPYPQVPLGWRKVTLEWDDGWWFLDFSHQESH